MLRSDSFQGLRKSDNYNILKKCKQVFKDGVCDEQEEILRKQFKVALPRLSETITYQILFFEGHKIETPGCPCILDVINEKITGLT